MLWSFAFGNGERNDIAKKENYHCAPYNGSSTFCGEYTPMKLCTPLGFIPSKGFFNQIDFEYYTNGRYKQDICPDDPSSVVPIDSKQDYCEFYACHNVEDCLNFSRPLCYAYCLHCFPENKKYCDLAIQRGLVAPEEEDRCDMQIWEGNDDGQRQERVQFVAFCVVSILCVGAFLTCVRTRKYLVRSLRGLVQKRGEFMGRIEMLDE